MDAYYRYYVAGWMSACVVALAVALWQRNSLSLLRSRYWRFLARPWKLVTFLVAVTGITLMAPYSGDPTWDHVNAPLMSVLTFTTSPWAVGTMCRFAKGWGRASHAYLGLCLMLLSASWSYDGYILLRDGAYPPSWNWNLMVSSWLYLSAGLLWNLDWQEERGIHLAFVRKRWPVPATTPVFRRLLPWALVLIVPVAIAFLYFLAVQLV